LEFGVYTPDGAEVVGDLLLQGYNDRGNISIGQNGALVDDGYLSCGELRVSNLWLQCFSPLGSDFGLPISENAQDGA
jgi:hypothetical protein